jgi:hypothetical protein
MVQALHQSDHELVRMVLDDSLAGPGLWAQWLHTFPRAAALAAQHEAPLCSGKTSPTSAQVLFQESTTAASLSSRALMKDLTPSLSVLSPPHLGSSVAPAGAKLWLARKASGGSIEAQQWKGLGAAACFAVFVGVLASCLFVRADNVSAVAI